MPLSTEQLAESLSKAPALIEQLKRDPAQLLTNLANSEQGKAAIKTGTRIVGDLLNRCVSSIPSAQKSLTTAPVSRPEIVSQVVGKTTKVPLQGGRSSVGVLGITSLAAIAGGVALLGVVSVVAVNRAED